MLEWATPFGLRNRGVSARAHHCSSGTGAGTAAGSKSWLAIGGTASASPPSWRNWR